MSNSGFVVYPYMSGFPQKTQFPTTISFLSNSSSSASTPSIFQPPWKWQSFEPTTFSLSPTPSFLNAQSIIINIPKYTPPVPLQFASLTCSLGKTPTLIKPNTPPSLCLLPPSCSWTERSTQPRGLVSCETQTSGQPLMMATFMIVAPNVEMTS